MKIFFKILLFVLVFAVVGGLIGGGVFLMMKNQKGESTSEQATTTGTSSSGQTVVTNTTQPSNPQGIPAQNTNIVVTQPGTIPPAGDVEDACKDVVIGGKWNLVVSVPDATFTPPYAGQSQIFEFGNNGTVDFTENYSSDGTTASAKHAGTWTKTGCDFTYKGTAEGSGNDSDVGPFTLKFIINATGKIDPDQLTIQGAWISDETYASAEGTTKQIITGTWKATKQQ